MLSKTHVLSLPLLLLLGLTPSPSAAAEQPTGTWFLRLDVEGFGLPPGTFQGGMLAFLPGGVLLVVDAGDLGGAPILALDTPQLGSWTARGHEVEAVGLFLRAEAANGDPLTWVRVHFDLAAVDRDRLAGTVRIFELPCDEPAPFPLFGCPDPVERANDFVQAPSFDLPVSLTRWTTAPLAQ